MTVAETRKIKMRQGTRPPEGEHRRSWTQQNHSHSRPHLSCSNRQTSRAPSSWKTKPSTYTRRPINRRRRPPATAGAPGSSRRRPGACAAEAKGRPHRPRKSPVTRRRAEAIPSDRAERGAAAKGM